MFVGIKERRGQRKIKVQSSLRDIFVSKHNERDCKQIQSKRKLCNSLQCIHCQQWYVRLYYRMNGFTQRAGMEKQNSQQILRWADECHKMFYFRSCGTLQFASPPSILFR